jgi:ribA/ribD-fused uncharacterized protein
MHSIRSREQLIDVVKAGENCKCLLVEASPADRVWGIGLDAHSPDAQQPERWKGLNLLGFALMEVRDAMAIGQAIGD